jgi:hypothetical protein
MRWFYTKSDIVIVRDSFTPPLSAKFILRDNDAAWVVISGASPRNLCEKNHCIGGVKYCAKTRRAMKMETQLKHSEFKSPRNLRAFHSGSSAKELTFHATMKSFGAAREFGTERANPHRYALRQDWFLSATQSLYHIINCRWISTSTIVRKDTYNHVRLESINDFFHRLFPSA